LPSRGYLRSKQVGLNFEYLTKSLKARGFDVEEGEVVPNTPLRYLCVRKPEGPVTREDVLQALDDPHIDLSNVDRPAGNLGTDS
jgi:hypothetical protein